MCENWFNLVINIKNILFTRNYKIFNIHRKNDFAEESKHFATYRIENNFVEPPK